MHVCICMLYVCMWVVWVHVCEYTHISITITRWTSHSNKTLWRRKGHTSLHTPHISTGHTITHLHWAYITSHTTHLHWAQHHTSPLGIPPLHIPHISTGHSITSHTTHLHSSHISTGHSIASHTTHLHSAIPAHHTERDYLFENM